MRFIISNSWRIITGLALTGIALYACIILIRHITSPLNPYYMKPSTFFSIMAIAIIGIITLSACSNTDTRTSTDYTILRDLTDSTLAMPDKAELITDLEISTNIWNGINFNFFNVSDVSYTPHWRISLVKGGKRIASSEFSRKREVEGFKARLSALLDSAAHDTAGREHSSIYLPMVEELTRLANGNADRKVLVVLSDLMENTPDLSFYKPRTFAELESDPDKIKDELFAKEQLPDLTGVEIRLIYQPKNAKDDIRFQRVSNFFKQMFEAQGAKVTISANLPN
jgi:hypothetical protein